MWSDLWPFFLTALLTLVATLAVQLVVQFYVVPRVETRKRREDRWERDLLSLGELLTLEQSSAATQYHHAAMMIPILESAVKSGIFADDEGAIRMREAGERLRTLAREYDVLSVRIDWLVDRVSSIDPDARRLRELADANRRYRAALLTASKVSERGQVSERLKPLDKAAAIERSAVDDMVTAVKGLASGPIPRARRGTRMR